jgi:hypothetical protein
VQRLGQHPKTVGVKQTHHGKHNGEIKQLLWLQEMKCNFRANRDIAAGQSFSVI